MTPWLNSERFFFSLVLWVLSHQVCPSGATAAPARASEPIQSGYEELPDEERGRLDAGVSLSLVDGSQMGLPNEVGVAHVLGHRGQFLTDRTVQECDSLHSTSVTPVTSTGADAAGSGSGAGLG